MTSSFNLSFSQLLKNLLDFRITKLESISKNSAHFETIPQYLHFFSLFLYIYLRNKRDMRLTYFLLIAFACLYSLTGSSFSWYTFIKLKACDQIYFSWYSFKAKRIHVLHLNVNSLLPKIDKIRYIAARTNTAVMGVSESKLDETILQSEIQISKVCLKKIDSWHIFVCSSLCIHAM